MSYEVRRLIREELETNLIIVFIFYISILMLNIMIFIADLYTVSGLQEFLAASPQTPWGILTSFFVHSDEAHLLNNMVSLFLFLILLVASNAFVLKVEVRRRIMTTLPMIFSIPAILNVIMLIVYPKLEIIGSSGIIYTLEGICLGFSLLNTLELRKIRDSILDERRIVFSSLLVNLVIVVGFLFTLVVLPIESFGGGYETALWYHCTAFSGGFLFAMSHLVLPQHAKTRLGYLAKKYDK